MNYCKNTTKWKAGDLVIHDVDAKRPEMLMRVIGYDRTGACQTTYAVPNEMNQDALRIKRRRKPEVWVNSIEVLQDPKRFGITADQKISEEALK
jgi:hypothetical protein